MKHLGGALIAVVAAYSVIVFIGQTLVTREQRRLLRRLRDEFMEKIGHEVEELKP